jgi:hypothetical protein
MLIVRLLLDGAVMTRLPVPEPVVVVAHDVGKVQQLAQLLDVVGSLTDLVHVAGQRRTQKKILGFESLFQFLFLKNMFCLKLLKLFSTTL